MNAVELISLNIELEFGINSTGLLVPRPGSDAAEVPRFSIVRYEEGYITYFRHDLPCRAREQLAVLAFEQAFNDHETVKHILAEDTPCEKMWIGNSYYFTHIPTLDEFPDVVLHQGCYVVKVAGEPVAWAWTVRGNELAAEVATETLPAFRRRGYGRQVTAAWACHVMQEGKVAFFSHERDNLASRALAWSLGVVQYSSVVEYK